MLKNQVQIYLNLAILKKALSVSIPKRLSVFLKKNFKKGISFLLIL